MRSPVWELLGPCRQSPSLSPNTPQQWKFPRGISFALFNKRKPFTRSFFFKISGRIQKMHFCNPAQDAALWREPGHLGRKAPVSHCVACLEPSPPSSSQAQTLRGATVTLQTEQRRRLPRVFTHEVAPPSRHHLKCLFLAICQRNFCFPYKG